MRERVIFNWSGGKDSALCLYTILKAQQYEVLCLLTSISEEDQRISMHGVRADLLDAQAASIGLPSIKMQVPEMPAMEIYEKAIANVFTDLRTKGATGAVFGDIFLADLRKYREDQMAGLDLKAFFPLWARPTRELVLEFIALGFKAVVSCVNANYLDKTFAGRIIDEDFINDLPEHVDPCGENGEYHSFVFDGPIFKHPISYIQGDTVYRKYGPPLKDEAADDRLNTGTINNSNPFEHGYWYCDLLLDLNSQI